MWYIYIWTRRSSNGVDNRSYHFLRCILCDKIMIARSPSSRNISWIIKLAMVIFIIHPRDIVIISMLVIALQPAFDNTVHGYVLCDSKARVSVGHTGQRTSSYLNKYSCWSARPSVFYVLLSSVYCFPSFLHSASCLALTACSSNSRSRPTVRLFIPFVRACVREWVSLCVCKRLASFRYPCAIR